MQVQRAPMEAWYMDDSTEEQRKPHHRNPPEYVSLEELAGISIFKYFSSCIREILLLYVATYTYFKLNVRGAENAL